MCRERGVAWIAASLLVCGSAHLAAQSTASLRERLALLERSWREAAAASAAVDSAARVRMAGVLDTTRIESLTILAPSEWLGPAATAGRIAWRRLFGAFGDHLRSGKPYPLLLVLTVAGEPPPLGFPLHAIPVPVLRGATEDTLLAAQMDIAVQGFLANQYDDALKRWLVGRIDTRDVVPPALFVDLATSPSVVARACLVGSVDACGTALVLTTPNDPATAWYDAGGRRAVVALVPRDVAPNLLDLDQCVSKGSDAACLREMRSSKSPDIPPPVGWDSRELLVRLALHLGGPGAFDRLITSAPRPIGERLALAARVPIDSLLGRWRAAVLSSRPASVDLTPETAWIALLWGVLFAVFLLRSSRWRV
jgi:hypothetical protein